MQSVIVNYRISNLGGQFPNYQVEKMPFKDHTFVYAVSVGKDHFENDWVSGFVNFLKSCGSTKVRVLVADSLQRHNLSCYYQNAYEKSLKNGEIWASKYRPLFQELGKDADCEFTHWEEYRCHPEFPKYLQYVQHLHATDPKFQAALGESITEYSRRSTHREINCSIEEMQKRSAAYFVEECAVIWILAQNQNLKGIMYPSKVVKPIGYTLELINREMRKENPFLWFELRPKKVKKTNGEGARLQGRFEEIESIKQRQ